MQDKTLDDVIESDRSDGRAELLRSRNEPAGDSVKQSQRPCRTHGGHSPPCQNAAGCAKQSQFPADGQSAPVETRYPASWPSKPVTQAPITELISPTRQTNPTGAVGSVCRVPARAFAETKNVASLQGDDCAKQSQSAEGPACETESTEAAGSVCRAPVRAYQETPYGVTTNGTDCAEQSQPPKPAAGFVMVRPGARYAWHYDGAGRS